MSQDEPWAFISITLPFAHVNHTRVCHFYGHNLVIDEKKKRT